MQSDTVLHPAKRILFLYLLIVIGILGIVGALFGFLIENFPIGYVTLSRIWISIAFVCAGFLIYACLWRLTSEYIISDDRITAKTGILSRRHIHIPIGRVIDYRLMRPIVERLIGLGSVHIDTAGNDEEIVMQQISETELAAAGYRLDKLLDKDNRRPVKAENQGT